jgi:hypothetical protein
MMFASRATSAIVEVRAVVNGIGGLALDDAHRGANRLPRGYRATTRLRGRLLGCGDHRTTLAVAKFSEFAHEVLVRRGDVRGKSHPTSIAHKSARGRTSQPSTSCAEKAILAAARSACWVTLRFVFMPPNEVAARGRPESGHGSSERSASAICRRSR